MKSLPVKWKMVSFRLSPSDYAEALEFCRVSGHRNMSSFALSAMRTLVPAMLPSNELAKEACDLSRHVDQLSAVVKRLLEAVGTESMCQYKLGAALAAASGAAGASSNSKP